MTKSEKKQIDIWSGMLQGLGNDARYWDLRHNYGDYSPELYAHLESCARYQASGSQPATKEQHK